MTKSSKLSRLVSVFASVVTAFSTATFAAPNPLPSSRSVFEFDESWGTIRKLQVDLFERNGTWIAVVKALSGKGSVRSGELACRKIAEREFACRRDDDGGRFSIQTGSQPKLTFAYFSAANEGEFTQIEIRSASGVPVTVVGAKSVISRKDAF